MTITGSEVGDIYRAEVIALRDLLGNLLARIHGDGGHHQEAVGLVQACEDANAKICKTWAEIDRVRYEAENAARRAAEDLAAVWDVARADVAKLQTENAQANNETRAALEQLEPLQFACALVVDTFDAWDTDFGHHPNEAGDDCPEDSTCTCLGIAAINACAKAIGR